MNYNNSMNNGPRISDMGSGTSILQLRKDVAATLNKQQDEPEDIYERSRSVKNIVEDINNDDDIATRKKSQIQKETTTDESEEEMKSRKKDKKTKKEQVKSGSFLYSVPTMIKDPILIWLIFILMSQNFFKNMVAKYLHSIVPNEAGVVGFTGIAMYGLILVVLYSLIKFVLQMAKVY